MLRALLAEYHAPGTVYPLGGFPDYVRRLAERDDDESDRVWREQLAELPGPSLVAEGHTPSDRFADTAVEPADDIDAAARSAGVPLSVAVHSAWAVTLGGILHGEDVVFGSTVSGRDADVPGIEDMVGLFINTIPVRARWAGATTARRPARLGAGTPERGAAAPARLAGQDRPPDRQRAPVRHPGGVRRGDRRGRACGRPGDDAGHHRHRERGRPALPVDAGGGARARRPPALQPDLRRRTAAGGERPGDPAHVHPDPRPACSPGRTPWSATWRPTPRRPAPDHPDDPGRAVRRRRAPRPGRHRRHPVRSRRRHPVADLRRTGGRRRTSWRSALRAAGVGPGKRVAVAVPRSLEQVVALVAIVTAGGAYVPLDLAYPDERLEYILADAAPQVVLVDREQRDRFTRAAGPGGRAGPRARAGGRAAAGHHASRGRRSAGTTPRT